MTAAPPQLAPGIAAGLRRLRLAAMRQLAPELLLRSQLTALGARLAGRDACNKLARNHLEDFLAQLHDSAAAAIEDRQQVLRLLVKDVLIGPGKITIRHRIPARGSGSGPIAPRAFLRLRYGG